MLGKIGLVVAGVTAAVGVLVGYGILARKAPKVALAIAGVLMLAGIVYLFEFFLPGRYPEVDPDLPLFLRFVWTWMLVFTLLAVLGLAGLIQLLRRHRPDQGSAEPGRYPDIDTAWEAIRLRLAQARIDPAAQKWFLMLSPDPQAVEALLQGAGEPFFAEVPEPGTAAVRLLASAEGLFLNCSRACGLGLQSPEGTDRLSYLAEKLARLDPDQPPVRGVVVVLPVDWAGQSQAAEQAAATREDLQALRTTLRLTLPVFAVLPRVETLPGLSEFVARIPEAMRLSRCGFAIPSQTRFNADLMHQGLGWLAGWFDTWCWSLMAGDILNTAGNGRLYSLAAEVRRLRRRWRGVLEAAFSTHRDAEPVLLRGVYLAATGDGPNQSAFTAGLLRGSRGRILADHWLADWSTEGRQSDRRYLRRAGLVGLSGGLLALAAWVFMVSREPFWGAGLAAILAAWGLAALRGFAR